MIAAGRGDGLRTLQPCKDLTVCATGLVEQAELSARVTFGPDHKQPTAVLSSLLTIPADQEQQSILQDVQYWRYSSPHKRWSVGR